VGDEEAQARRDGVIQMGAHVYPHAGLRDLVFGTLFILWLFFFDDIFDESGSAWEVCEAAAERTLHIVRHGKLPEKDDIPTPTEKLLLKVRQLAIRSVHHPSVAERFLKSCEIYILEGAMPMEKLRHQELPSLEEYVPLRTTDGGVDTCLCCYEIVAHLVLSDELVEEPRVARMRTLSSRVIAFSNDIYSYNREKRHNNLLNSLNIRCLTRTFNDALTDQIQEINAWGKEFIELKKSIQESSLWEDGNDLALYIEGMESSMAGIKLWSESSKRYNLQSLLPN